LGGRVGLPDQTGKRGGSAMLTCEDAKGTWAKGDGGLPDSPVFLLAPVKHTPEGESKKKSAAARADTHVFVNGKSSSLGERGKGLGLKPEVQKHGAGGGKNEKGKRKKTRRKPRNTDEPLGGPALFQEQRKEERAGAKLHVGKEKWIPNG